MENSVDTNKLCSNENGDNFDTDVTIEHDLHEVEENDSSNISNLGEVQVIVRYVSVVIRQ